MANTDPKQQSKTTVTAGPPPVKTAEMEKAGLDPEAPVIVSAAKKGEDLVTITIFQKLEPPPVIGNWNGSHELGVSAMVERQAYKVPRRVAEVLVDAKKAVVIS